jgi:hypothetical protein
LESRLKVYGSIINVYIATLEDSVTKPCAVVARAHFEISNVHMYHCNALNCNIMKTTLLRNMQIINYWETCPEQQRGF